MSDVTCRSCDAPTDSFLCQRCADCREPVDKRCGTCLVDLLAELPAGIADLRIAAARRGRVGNPPHVSADDQIEAAQIESRAIPARLRSLHGALALSSTVMPVSLVAAALYDQAVTAVLTWARHIAETRGVDLPAADPVRRVREHRTVTDERDELVEVCTWTWQRPPVTIAALCSWLIEYIDSIRLDEAAGEMHGNAGDLADAIAVMIDRRDPDMYAGRCDAPDVSVELAAGVIMPSVATCGSDLYARFGATEVKCETCGMVYDIEARKRWLLDQLPDVIAPTSAIANGLTSLAEQVTPSMIRQMAHRGEIFSRGVDADRSALYRVGDVLDVLAARTERKLRKLSDRGRRIAS